MIPDKITIAHTTPKMHAVLDKALDRALKGLGKAMAKVQTPEEQAAVAARTPEQRDLDLLSGLALRIAERLGERSFAALHENATFLAGLVIEARLAVQENAGKPVN